MAVELSPCWYRVKVGRPRVVGEKVGGRTGAVETLGVFEVAS